MNFDSSERVLDPFRSPDSKGIPCGRQSNSPIKTDGGGGGGRMKVSKVGRKDIKKGWTGEEGYQGRISRKDIKDGYQGMISREDIKEGYEGNIRRKDTKEG